MNPKIHLSIFLLSVALVLPTARAGDITGTVILKGTPPPEKPIDFANFAVCGKLHTEPVKTQFYVVGENKGLKDVVVMLTDVKGKSTGASAPPLVLDQKGCMYVPYIAAVQTGQKIVVKNSDPELHNVHMTPETDGNEEKNIAQPAGSQDLEFSLPVAEDFVRFKCDVHPWMFSYVTAVDHPWFAVTDKDGKFKIANVPPGTYTIQATHRKAGKTTRKITMAENPVTADFTLQIP
jgi:hypothetical protein